MDNRLIALARDGDVGAARVLGVGALRRGVDVPGYGLALCAVATAHLDPAFDDRRPDPFDDVVPNDIEFAIAEALGAVLAGDRAVADEAWARVQGRRRSWGDGRLWLATVAVAGWGYESWSAPWLLSRPGCEWRAARSYEALRKLLDLSEASS